MAPNISEIQHFFLRDLILDSNLKDDDIARRVKTTERTVRRARSNLIDFGSTRAPSNGRGRPRKITEAFKADLFDWVTENPTAFTQEMASHMSQEPGRNISKWSVQKALKSSKWSKKKVRIVSEDRRPELRNLFFERMLHIHSYQLVFLDESGIYEKDVRRSRGWAPLGVTPVQKRPTRRGSRWNIISAYAQDGTVLTWVYQGPTDGSVFADFVLELLPYCGNARNKESKSVLVADNASFHHTESIKRMCEAAGVECIPTAPYYPEHNPIEEYFAEAKNYIKSNPDVFNDGRFESFQEGLECCLSVVGARVKSAEGHFRHAGFTIEYP